MIGAKSWMKLWSSRKRKGLHHMTCIVSFCFVMILPIETLGSMGKWPGSSVGYGVPYPNHSFQIRFSTKCGPRDRTIQGDPKLCGIHCGIMVPATALRKTLSGTIHGQACLCWLSIKGGYVISYNITAPCIVDGEKSIQRTDRWFSTMFIWILLSRSKQLWSARPTYQQTVGLAWSCFLQYGIQPLLLESQQAFSMRSIVYTAELFRLPRLPLC